LYLDKENDSTPLTIPSEKYPESLFGGYKNRSQASFYRTTTGPGVLTSTDLLGVFIGFYRNLHYCGIMTWLELDFMATMSLQEPLGLVDYSPFWRTNPHHDYSKAS
jgi:hypothetical protein